jgi:hypothetical protein
MSLERWIRLFAGAFVVVSVTLSYLHSPYWLLFTLFVGVNLFQSALTGICPLESILRALGVGPEAGKPAGGRGAASLG